MFLPKVDAPMHNLPAQLPTALYKQQALLLVRRLSKLRVTARLKSFVEDTGD